MCCRFDTRNVYIDSHFSIMDNTYQDGFQQGEVDAMAFAKQFIESFTATNGRKPTMDELEAAMKEELKKRLGQ